jgi:hypothetical protein
MTDSKEVGPIPRWLRRVTASDGAICLNSNGGEVVVGLST